MSDISPTDENGIYRDENGDPESLGTRMFEVDSMERAIDGLRLAAEGAAHIAAHEYQAKNISLCNLYAGMARRLDQVRLLAVEVAGNSNANQHETQEVRSKPMNYKNARHRLRDGLKQASGGMRQIATCHRGDLRWSTMAQALEDMLQKINGHHAMTLGRAPGAIIH